MKEKPKEEKKELPDETFDDSGSEHNVFGPEHDGTIPSVLKILNEAEVQQKEAKPKEEKKDLPNETFDDSGSEHNVFGTEENDRSIAE